MMLSPDSGFHYHLGRVTRVYKEGGVTYYDGHHLKGEEDDKWVTYTGYDYEFTGMTLDDLRISPNVMDLLA
jgi:hypothetical protein